jgi:hypothetical protein
MESMPAIAATLASLRFYGNDLEPEMLTAQLGASPSRCWKKGDTFGPTGTATRKNGAWILRAEQREPGELNGLIDEIFSKLTADLSVWKDLANRYRPDLFLGLFLKQSNEGLDVNARSLSLMADRGVSLALDVHGARPDLLNIQVVDGADKATFSIFQATREEFFEIFPGPGQDMEIAEDFVQRVGEARATQILTPIWERPILKHDAKGIHGTLYYDYQQRRQYLPESKREVDVDELSINSAQRELFAANR